MGKVYWISWLAFKEGIKHRILYGIISFFIFVAAVSLLFADFFAIDVVKVGIDFALSGTSLTGLLILFFLCIPMLNRDLDKRTVYFPISSPVSRAQYILGKFFGLFFILLACMVILGILSCLLIKLFMTLYKAYIPLNFSWAKIFLALVFSFLSFLVLLSVIFFFWSISSKGFIVSTFSLMTYIIGESIAVVKEMVSSHPGVIKHIVNFASWVFPNLSYFDLKKVAAHGLHIHLGYILKVSIYAWFYIAILLTLTIIIFQKKDLG
ncbi:hypothetical protein BLFGPEAP_02328 [Candidatus Methanoperedenaceae archaeon GB50]|nr:hypothetical protein BLFGPEAP_02328 [Candidatus Methanoperedenaceae archaeon GB50]